MPSFRAAQRLCNNGRAVGVTSDMPRSPLGSLPRHHAHSATMPTPSSPVTAHGVTRGGFAPSRVLVPLALGLIVLLAGGLRFYGLDWDNGHHLHPDERFLAIVGDRIRFPDDPPRYFDTARSPLNPYNQGFDGFAYGTAPLFLTRAVAEWLDMASYDRIHLVGRALSASFDLGTVLLAFFLGRLVYGTAVGLVASALLAVTVLHVQLSHFFAVDTFLAFGTTLALYGAYRAWLRGGARDWALLGLALGFAAATKLSAALLLPIVGLVVLVPPPAPHRRQPLARRLLLFALCGTVALLVYRLGDPYSFGSGAPLGLRPNVQRFADLDRWVKISSGEIEVPFMIQWAGTPNPWFALRNLATWGFGPAGLAVLTALGLALVQLHRWPTHGVQLLLVAWCVMNLAYFGFQFAKFMRYLLPVYPALAVLGGALLVRLFTSSARSATPRLRPLARFVGPVVLASTALYAVMFVSIYSRPNTRIQASEWIYANIPDGSTLAVEHWDDALPLRLPDHTRRYRDVSMELYDDESPAKARKLADNLRRADYLILGSNRLADSIPRLPRRFPIAVEYYRLLFSGELGFDLVARFDSRPALFGLTVDDTSAQEDFTVYDHPTVLVFQKSAHFSPRGVADRLTAVPLDQVERSKPAEADARRGLLLSPSEWERVRRSGTWADSFSLNGLSARLPVPIWLIVVELLGLAALPLCWWLFPSLADRGFALSKLLGLAIVSYACWLAASLDVAAFGRGLALTCALGLALGGVAIAARHRRALIPDLLARTGTLLVTEVVFLGAFAAMLAIRSANPDLWHPAFGGEKPMDFAYLNAVVKTPSFPPYDPWFAGGYINYYYYGLVLVAVLTHLSAMPPAQAYNLAVATIFALTFVTAFAFGSSVTGLWRGRRPRSLSPRMAVAGVASASALCVLGNLDGALQVRDGLWKLGGEGIPSALPLLTGLTRTLAGLWSLVRGGALPAFDFWRSTRFIGPEEPGPIHEFPFFTFLYGDLHAHMLALPLQVATILVALQLVRARPRNVWLARRGTVGRRRWPGLAGPLARPCALLLLAAQLIGSLRATNTWDFPTYLLLGAAAAALMLRSVHGVGWLGVAGGGALALCGLYLLSWLLFVPYHARYELFYTGVEPVKASTDLRQFLTIHGLLLLAVSAWLVFELARRWAAKRANVTPLTRGAYYGVAVPALTLGADLRATAAIAIGAAPLLALASAGRGVLAILLGYGAVGAAVVVARRGSPALLFLLTMGAAAATALALPELVAVRGDVGRMNTVFKFYLQAWVLLALLAGPAVVGAVHRLRTAHQHATWGRLWVTALVLAVSCAGVYPLLATPTKLGLRFAPLAPTLDGMAYMRHATYADNGRDLGLPDDYRAIVWMLENVAGSPVVLEGQAPLYHWGSRFSSYTGLPTVLGWDWHQQQQRFGYQARIRERQRDVALAYDTPDWDRAEAILRTYDVAYIVVGGLERAYYSPAGLAKFEGVVGAELELAYRDGGVTIYRVRNL